MSNLESLSDDMNLVQLLELKTKLTSQIPELTNQVSIYQAIKAAGIETDNWCSDLYFPETKESMEILRKYPLHLKNSTKFSSAIDGTRWIDVPFAFDPEWERMERMVESWCKNSQQ